jgi:hypothetical protein
MARPRGAPEVDEEDEEDDDEDEEAELPPLPGLLARIDSIGLTPPLPAVFADGETSGSFAAAIAGARATQQARMAVRVRMEFQEVKRALPTG